MTRSIGLMILAVTTAQIGCGGPSGRAAGSGTAANGGGARAQLIARIDSIVNAPIAAGKVAGTSVAVVKGGDTLILKGYGKADLELDVPTPPRASYEIGSVSKQFTAAAILQLADEKKLDLDDNLTKYFPRYRTQGNTVTLRRLLDHTSGIKGYTEIPEFWLLAFQHLPKDTLVALFASKPFDFGPGDQQTYNNSAYFLAALIIEKVSGQSYAQYVTDHLFAKAGMKDSYQCSEKALHQNHVHGYDTDSTGFVQKRYADHTWSLGSGGLCSTAADLMAWNLALHGGKVLSPAAYAELIKPSELSDGTKLRYAKGLALVPIAGHRAIHHSGGIFGFLSESEYYPDDSLVVVVLQNTASRYDPSETAERIVLAVLGAKAETAQKYDGALAQLAGRYTGRGRGPDTDLTIVVGGDALIVTGLGPAPDTLSYRGNDTFGAKDTQLIFRKTAGTVTGLDTDTGYGHNRLRRQ